MGTRKDNGQGSIYFNEVKGYWYASIQWTDSCGNRKKKQFSGKTKTTVKHKLDLFKKELLLSGPDSEKPFTGNNMGVAFQAFNGRNDRNRPSI